MPSVQANHEDVGELDAVRQQSARDQAYVTHLATVVASLEKQIAEHTLKARDFESKAQKFENDLNDKIAEANRNAKGFVVELAARVDRVGSRAISSPGQTGRRADADGPVQHA